MPILDIMIDLETLSSASDAAMVAIGAVRFDLRNGVVPDSGKNVFYQVINAKSAQKAGGRIDADTVMWWMGQSEGARKALLVDDAMPIETALKDFSAWVREVPCGGMWGNGADFDNVVLCNSYLRLGYTAPWAWTMNRCYRTMNLVMGAGIEFTREGTHHNALHDAISQARHLCKIFGQLPE